MKKPLTVIVAGLLLGKILTAEPVYLLDGMERYPVDASRLEYLEDSGGKLSAEEVMTSGEGTFKGIDHGFRNFGFTDSVYWFRFHIQNLNSDIHKWYLEIEYPPLDQIEIYRKGNPAALYSIGDLLENRGEGDLSFGNYAVSLNIDPGSEQVYYVRVKTESSMVVPIVLWSPGAFIDHVQETSIAIALYYGIILAMILYNLFLFISLKDFTYFFYVLFSGSILFYILLLNGIATVYFWPTFPVWNMYAYIAFSCSAIIWGMLFVRRFLFLSLYNKMMDRVFLSIILLTILLPFSLAFVSYSTVIRLIGVIGMISGLIALLSGIYVFARGFRPAKYFLLSWALFLAGFFSTLLRNFGFVPSGLISDYGFQFGSAMEVLFLSFGLAHRIKVLRLEKEEEQSANRARNDFVIALGHELRKPLEMILGSIDLIQKTEMRSEQQKYLQMMEKGSDSLKRISSDILDLDAIQKETLAIRKIDFRSQDLLDQTLQLFQEKAISNDIRLSWSVRNGVPDYLHGDFLRLSQVINTLLNNLMYTTTDECEIRVDLAPCVDPPYTSGSEAVWIELQIFETAGGLSLEERARIFEQLKKLKIASGVDLGLFVAGKLIHLLGGKIEVEDDPRLGFSIRILLPLEPARGELPDSENHLLKKEIPLYDSNLPGKVLLAEESEESRELTRHFLKSTGYRIDEATDGGQLIEMFRRHKYNTIIVDLSLPGKDIFRVIQKIREMEASWKNGSSVESAKIIGISSRAQSVEIEKARQVGCNDCLSRPIDRERLLSIVMD